MQTKLARILLVEDNEDDVFITRRSIAKSGIDANVEHVNNGRACLDFLRSADELPDLIFLDINMPLMNGREVLVEIGADEKLRHIPVVVLSTSESGREVLEMHRLQCNSYVTKPLDFDQFQETIAQICRYWFSLVALPSTDAAAAGQ